MMQAIHAQLGVGQLSFSKGCVTLTVRNLKDILTVIIPHFENYPLRGGKNLAFLRFKMVCLLKVSKMHLQLPVYLQIVKLTCINPDLYAKIMNATIDKFGVLPDFEILDIHQLAPPLIAAEDMDIDYVTGLIDGDGSITFSFPTSQRKVVSNIIVTASLDDLEVMNDLVVFFGCGKVYRLKKKAYIFYVSNASHILNKV